MAALTDPVNERNIISRYKDFMYTAWQGVTWGTNDVPVYAPGTGYATVVIPATAMGGPNTEDPGQGAFIGDGSPGLVINAYNIFNYLNYFTYEYCKIRNIRAVLFVNGLGGNTGNYPTPGEVYDVTAVANYSNRSTQAAAAATAAAAGNASGKSSTAGVVDYVTPLSSGPTGGVAANQVVSALELQYFMERCLQAYNNFARNQTYRYDTTVCHASCHSSCHFARGRR